jgi:hypothetical protein
MDGCADTEQYGVHGTTETNDVDSHSIPVLIMLHLPSSLMPNSTKSPYSIFDNGSNTFAREGNTVGAEQPMQPSISQSDYFQNRQQSFFVPKSILRL